MAIASLVLGIVSAVFAWVPPISFVAWAAGITGIILAVKARKEAPSGIATAGLVLSIIGTALGFIGLICSVCVCVAGNKLQNELTGWVNSLN